jgi:hypothetical protein
LYVDNKTPVDLVCINGHACRPQPGDILTNGGICKTCAGHDPADAERRFRARVVALGATFAAGARYIDTRTHVDLICTNGHLCRTKPGGVLTGRGICQTCVVRFDRLYLINHSEANAIKVGIASDTARLKIHVRRGYQLIEEYRDLTPDVAKYAERIMHRCWRDQGWKSVAEAPRDGRTETCSATHLDVTQAFLPYLLGRLHSSPPQRMFSELTFEFMRAFDELTRAEKRGELQSASSTLITGSLSV